MTNVLLLTKDTTFIIGPIAQLLGYLMNGIFWVLDKIGIPSVGLSIIVFTFIIYLCLLPLTYRQQKFSKLSQMMQPELQKIQKKYKNKTDQDSQLKMSEETQAVYKKYGVSPMGSCVQLLIQMPILFALYRVIYNIPAYVTKVKNAYYPLVTHLIAHEGSEEYLLSTTAGSQYSTYFTKDNYINNVGDTVANVYIDVLNRFSTSDWNALAEEFGDLAEEINNTVVELNVYNNFLGLNIGNSPWYVFKNAIATGSILAIIAAIAIPALAAITQLINIALSSSGQNSGATDQQSKQMDSSMKVMNYTMPIISAWFCFTLPSGMGLYWIAGAVIRSIQQVLINRHIDKIDMNAYMKEQQEKAKEKAKKRNKDSVDAESVLENAKLSTKNNAQALTKKRRTLAEKASYQNKEISTSEETTPVFNSNQQYDKNSITYKANMVSEYNYASHSYSTGRKSRMRKNMEKNNAKAGNVNSSKNSSRKSVNQDETSKSDEEKVSGKETKNK